MNREEKIEAIASAITALAAEHGEDNLFTREEVAERCDLKTTEIAEIGALHFGELHAAVTKSNAAIRLLRYATLPTGGARMFVTSSASSNDRTVLLFGPDNALLGQRRFDTCEATKGFRDGFNVLARAFCPNSQAVIGSDLERPRVIEHAVPPRLDKAEGAKP